MAVAAGGDGRPHRRRAHRLPPLKDENAENQPEGKAPQIGGKAQSEDKPKDKDREKEDRPPPPPPAERPIGLLKQSLERASVLYRPPPPRRLRAAPAARRPPLEPVSSTLGMVVERSAKEPSLFEEEEQDDDDDHEDHDGEEEGEGSQLLVPVAVAFEPPPRAAVADSSSHELFAEVADSGGTWGEDTLVANSLVRGVILYSYEQGSERAPTSDRGSLSSAGTYWDDNSPAGFTASSFSAQFAEGIVTATAECRDGPAMVASAVASPEPGDGAAAGGDVGSGAALSVLLSPSPQPEAQPLPLPGAPRPPLGRPGFSPLPPAMPPPVGMRRGMPTLDDLLCKPHVQVRRRALAPPMKANPHTNLARLEPPLVPMTAR